MHVCHLAKYYAPATGGIETHVQTLARGQAEAGAQVTVVCVNHQSAAGSDVLERPFASSPDVEERDGDVRVLRAGRRFALSKWDVAPGLVRLIRSLAKGPDAADVLHLHIPNVTMTLGLLQASPSTPLVVAHHSDVVKQAMLLKVFQTFERKLLQRASTIVTTNPRYLAGSRQLADFQAKVQTLTMGIDLEPFLNPSPSALAARDKLRAEFGEPLWLSVGRLVYYKGLNTAIAALPALPGKLAIVGEGPLRNELQRQAEALGVADRVIFFGRTTGNELVGAYHAATALLFPSNARSEAFGLVQVEAMASGCPVINTSIEHSGVPWVSPHDESGLTVAPNSPQELAEAAMRIFRSRKLREQLATGAILRARQHFNRQTMVDRSLAIYRSVLENRQPAMGEAVAP